MDEKKEEKRMEESMGFKRTELRHCLEELAETAHNLSQNLSESDGRPLTTAEKRVLKMVKLQIVSQRMDEIKYFLMADYVDDAVFSLAYLQAVVREGW